MTNAQEFKELAQKPEDVAQAPDALKREIELLKIDLDAETSGLKKLDNAEELCEKLALLQNFCEDKIEKLEELIQKENREKELVELVGKCRAPLGAWDPNDPKLRDVVSDLKRIDALKNGELSSAPVGLPAIFVLLRQPAEVELDYELVRKNDKRFTATKYGFEDVFLRWECDFGGNEGIYLDLYFDYYDADNKRSRVDFASIKTLKEDDDSFRDMCALGCEYAINSEGQK